MFTPANSARLEAKILMRRPWVILQIQTVESKCSPTVLKPFLTWCSVWSYDNFGTLRTKSNILNVGQWPGNLELYFESGQDLRKSAILFFTSPIFSHNLGKETDAGVASVLKAV